MKNNALASLPMFDVFQKWQEVYKLHSTDYQDFTKVFAHTDWCADENALVEVCAMLWLKKKEDKKSFEESCRTALKKIKDSLEAQIKAQSPQEVAPIREEPKVHEDKSIDKKEETKPEKPEIKPETPEIKSEQKPSTQTLYFSFDEAEAKAGKDIEPTLPTESVKYSFIFTPTHQTPLKDRNLQIQWRNFRKIQYKPDTNVLDYEAIIAEVAQQKYLTQLHYECVPHNEAKLITVIDDSTSMWAFSRLAEQIAQNASKVTQNEVFYCRNLISNYFTQKQKGKEDKVLEREDFYKKYLYKASVLFISDLGAVKTSFSSYRIAEMAEIQTQMYAHGVKNIVCLNPMPPERWINCSAKFIAKELPTFPAHEAGIKQAVYALRG